MQFFSASQSSGREDGLGNGRYARVNADCRYLVSRDLIPHAVDSDFGHIRVNLAHELLAALNVDRAGGAYLNGEVLARF